MTSVFTELHLGTFEQAMLNTHGTRPDASKHHGDEHGPLTYYVALPFVVSYDGSAPSGVVTIGDFAARRIDLD